MKIIHDLVSGLESEKIQLQADQIIIKTGVDKTVTGELNIFDQIDAQIENSPDGNKPTDLNEFENL